MSGAKKRKAELQQIETQTTLHKNFVQAANSISCLYAEAIQQQHEARLEGQAETLVGFCRLKAHSGASKPERGVDLTADMPMVQERLYSYICSQHGSSAFIPTAAMFEYLSHEMESVRKAKPGPSAGPGPP
jgi:hypothetical protein